jgi:hypothetical protein
MPCPIALLSSKRPGTTMPFPSVTQPNPNMKHLQHFLLLVCLFVGSTAALQAQTPNITQVPYLNSFVGNYSDWGTLQGGKVYPNAQHRAFRIGQLGYLIVPNATATVQMVVNTWEISNGFRTQAVNLYQEGILDATPGHSVIILRCDKVTPCSAGPGATCTVQHLPPDGVLGCAGQCCADPGPLLIDFIGDAIFPW